MAAQAGLPPRPDRSGERTARPRARDARPGPRPDLDVHELLKREALDQPLRRPEDRSGASDTYLVLDSFEKLRASATSRGEFRWNLMVQGVTGDEVIGVKSALETVTAIQMGAFELPMLPEVPYVLRAAPGAPTGTNQLVLVHNNTHGAALPPTLVLGTLPAGGQYPLGIPLPTAGAHASWVNNPYSQVPFGNRVTVQIQEAGLQSYSDCGGARHHFEFVVSYLGDDTGHTPNTLMAAPFDGYKWDTFQFTDALRALHGVTLIFRNPDIPISFEPDVLYDTLVAADGAAAPGPYLRFSYVGHGLSMGDRIFVRYFRSGVPVLDAHVNRAEGHVAAGDPTAPLGPGVPIPTPDTFWTDPAISTIDLTAPAPALPQVVTVGVAKRRLRIPVRVHHIAGRTREM